MLGAISHSLFGFHFASSLSCFSVRFSKCSFNVVIFTLQDTYVFSPSKQQHLAVRAEKLLRVLHGNHIGLLSFHGKCNSLGAFFEQYKS
jgi:hypothetical protein